MTPTFLLDLCLAGALVAPADGSPFERALEAAESALRTGDMEQARVQLGRALERDSRSLAVWDLRARLADAVGDRDEHVYSRHVEYRLAVAQDQPRRILDPLRERLEELDPLAEDLLDLRRVYIDKLSPLAVRHEKDQRWHSAIRVHQEILALDPERSESREAIERISARPDPALAETAQPKDLLADVSEEWIREHDTRHGEWSTAAELSRENYLTRTDAGYEVLVRTAEAMEQMNAFYREFFQYGVEGDGRQVPRITLHVFKDRDGYLENGIGPPVDWSAGHYTGSHVETYVQGTFSQTVGVLFHECAHQFVSIATTAQGWLNEGLASFFEGCRILANGTVIMNMPANGRLFALATRMEKGWMVDSWDGIPRGNPSAGEPERAPRMRTVIENAYPWGPPWYAPTWGFVYFLWNYQDPVDGRFVYRDAFREFINLSGGRRGPKAVENFEAVVLANPARPMKGVDYAGESARLPRTAEELDDLWKDWILALRDEVSGLEPPDRDYLAWARYALERKEPLVAREHCEKGVVAEPENVELLMEFAELLADEFDDEDRAAKIALQALQALERAEEPAEEELEAIERRLVKWDPRRRSMQRIHEQLEATAFSLAQRYLEAKLPTVAADLSWRIGTDLGFERLFEVFGGAVDAGSHPLVHWQLAYDENSLRGWDDAGQDVFTAAGEELHSSFTAAAPTRPVTGEAPSGSMDFRFLTYDTITSGDFSFEAEVYADGASSSFVGLMFGQKSNTSFHSLIYHPGQRGDERYEQDARQDYVDLTSFHGAEYDAHRHNALGMADPAWHRLRLDVIGTKVDVWFDGMLVVAHEFPGLEQLRGGFGLMTGPGAAKWRNVRYLARAARDPGALRERERRMRRMKEEAAARGERIGLSFVGIVPPFPASIRQWAQQPLSSWYDHGPVPTVLVFWSIEQNDRIPLQGWLNHLAGEYADVGLRVVSVVSPEDRSSIADYLARNPFPGSVGVDHRAGVGYGETFEQYLVHRFGMPRVLLLDVDHSVVWEGAPGFEFGKPWKVEDGSYLDTPLQELVRKRHLRTLASFREQWSGGGEEALRNGRFDEVLPLLQQLAEMDGVGQLDPEIGELRRRYQIMESALIGIEATAETLGRHEAEAAVEQLIDWAAKLGHPVDEGTRRELGKILRRPAARGWEAARKKVEQTLGRWDPERTDRFVTLAEGLVEDVSRMKGLFAGILHDQLERAVRRGDAELIKYVLEDAEHIPGRWLLLDHFEW